jgi:hypothetical protein
MAPSGIIGIVAIPRNDLNMNNNLPLCNLKEEKFMDIAYRELLALKDALPSGGAVGLRSCRTMKS